MSISPSPFHHWKEEMVAFSSISNSYFSLLLISLFFLAYSITDLNNDAMALLEFKSRLFGESSSLNWSHNATSLVCSWTRVTCDPRHGRVVGLDLSDMGLLGSLPVEIANLTFLTDLNMSRNNFNGILPQEWSRLRRLTFLDLGVNQLSGEIPPWIGFLNELQILRLYNNSFNGSLPDSIGNASKLVRLALQFNEFGGPIPTSVFNLSNLEVLNLGNNKFIGTLPSNLCSGMPVIQFLVLYNNKFEGEIPSNISACTQLQLIGLSFNKFSGSIPSDMSSPFSKLRQIYLAENSLVGELPKSLGEWKALEQFIIYKNKITGIIPSGLSNLTNLQDLDLSNNNFNGIIPNELGMLGNLELFAADNNTLRGEIPSGIFNISTLQSLSIVDNNITGHLPADFCFGLRNLEGLYLARNELSGELPPSISNCSRLQILDVYSNQFGGLIPDTIGQISSLEVINLQNNHFISESSEMSFLNSLTNCRHLRKLELSDNPFRAILPNSVGNLSASLETFEFYRCGLHGFIPTELGNLSGLLRLDLAHNNLIGSLPTTFEKLQKLQSLDVSKNDVSGVIPNALCNLQGTNYIYLYQNQIGGSLPNCIGNLSALREFWVSNNELESTLPPSLWQLNQILELNLSSNLLNGSITSGLGNLKVAYLVDLSINRFSGVIPTSIGEMQGLRNFSLAYNEFSGSIPESIGHILSLERVNLSHNHLSGRIPMSLQNVLSLISFDTSFNNLSGAIPTEGPFRNFSSLFFESNEGLCGEPRFGVPLCKVLKDGSKWRTEMLLLKMVLPLVIGFSIAFLLVYKLAQRFIRRHALHDVENRPSYLFPMRISYHALLGATKHFSNACLIGSGAFGSVYKGVLSDGNVVAIKVFTLQNDRALKSFDVECKVLRTLRHRNLCKVISACSNADIKALVMEYLPNGNLERWLHDEHNFLDISQRFSIMVDIAYALEYLHYGYEFPIAHCDLKPSNILLDKDMTGYLSDFGIAKLLVGMDNVVQTTTFATLGYIAPEYGSEGLVSTRCDVFSFGIVLMEVFTSKKPSNEEFEGDLTLRSLVKRCMSAGITEIVDPRLLNLDYVDSSVKLSCLSSMFELALKCSMESPSERITMKDVVASLKNISSKLSNNEC